MAISSNISSINFQRVSTHCFFHNDRSEKKRARTVHKEFTHLNQFDVTSSEALNTFKYLYDVSSKLTKSNRKANKKNCLLEASVNIKPETTMEELEEVKKYIEKEFNFTSLQIAIHRDEGHYKKDDEKFYTNQHAHMSFFTLDTNTGKQQYRREVITHEKLRDLQTAVAKILNMERGLDARFSRKERLSHKEYKIAKQQEEEIKTEELAKQKDLKQKIKILRTELQEQQATRKDYAELEQLNKELKAKIKTKDLTVQELEERLQDQILHFASHLDEKQEMAQKEMRELSQENQELKQEIAEQNRTIQELESQVYHPTMTYENKTKATYEAVAEHFERKYEQEVEKNSHLHQEIEDLKEKLVTTQNQSNSYFGLNEDLKDEIIGLKTQINSLESEINDLGYETTLESEKDVSCPNMVDLAIEDTKVNLKGETKQDLNLKELVGAINETSKEQRTIEQRLEQEDLLSKQDFQKSEEEEVEQETLTQFLRR